jgi:hypothetical protein
MTSSGLGHGADDGFMLREWSLARVELTDAVSGPTLSSSRPVAPCRHPPRRHTATRKPFDLTAKGPQRQAKQHEATQGNRRLPHRVLATSTRRGAWMFEACAHIPPRLDVLPIIAFCQCALPSSTTAGAHHVGRQRVDHRSSSLPRPSSRPEDAARETRQRPLRQQPARHPSC